MGKHDELFDKMRIYWVEIADQDATQGQIQLIKNILKPTGLVLDLACGTGRLVTPLNKVGFDAVGLDISSNLLKIAKTRLASIRLVRADMRLLPFKLRGFATAVSMDMSFGYPF